MKAKQKQIPEIVADRGGRLCVRIPTHQRRWIYARRDGRGRIIFDEPEKVGRIARDRTAELFKEIDRRALGIDRRAP